jgi:hypothetical protein
VLCRCRDFFSRSALTPHPPSPSRGEGDLCLRAASFNHLIGAGKERRRHLNAQHFGGREIYYCLRFSRLLFKCLLRWLRITVAASNRVPCAWERSRWRTGRRRVD